MDETWTVFEHDEDIWDAPAFGAVTATACADGGGDAETDAGIGFGADGDLIGDEFGDEDDEPHARLRACLERLAAPVTPNRTILFVEVKTRRTRRFGAPEEAVHPAKQANLRRAAAQWLGARGAKVPHVGVRFDVLALSVSGGDVDVRHIPGAF